MLFDSFVGYDIQEVRKTSREEGRTEGREEGRAEGRTEGREEGRIESEIRMIRKKLIKGFPVEEIADWMELEEEYIRRIAELHCQYPQDSDVQLLEKYMKLENV